ncbi:AraC family transcriptional regulator [Bacillus sp. FSL K6-3431]|uniref:AraC family transcriptional regulator n=1 Tax=Bacillus sp. FSL K6-3431 TaxID=2921500 RepID=UPI0030F6BAFF
MSQTLVYVPKNLHFKDLYLHTYGVETCWPGYFFGPAVREYYLIHFILDGEGVFKVNDEVYHLKKGQGFLIDPHIVTYYKADQNNPWTYCWIGFHGIQSESFIGETRLSNRAPIFDFDLNDPCILLFQDVIKREDSTVQGELRVHGLLYLLLAQIVEAYPKRKVSRRQIKKEEYVNKVIDFIEMNYVNKITIAKIAEYVGLDRSYLCSLFKDYLQTSIQQYLIHFRMNKACILLDDSDLSIGDIARSIGYEDPLLFSKMFKKYKGVSPKKYRNNAYTQMPAEDGKPTTYYGGT